MKYETTEDSNIIKEIRTVESDIHIDELEKQIKELVEQIKNIPKSKIEPDQETLEFWNEMNIGNSKDELEETLIKKEEFLKKIKGL